MDGEWLNRAGILAELVSFVLIAPEILGKERLRRVEEALEGWAERTIDTSGRVWMWKRGELVPFLPALSRDVSGTLLGELALLAGASSVSFFAVYLGAWAGVSTWLAWAYVGSLLFGLSAIGMVRLAGRRVYPVAVPLAVIGVPSAWLIAAFSTAVFLTLRRAVHLGLSLLSGENALRPLVFGTGVVLLFGGMAAQFVSTF